MFSNFKRRVLKRRNVQGVSKREGRERRDSDMSDEIVP